MYVLMTINGRFVGSIDDRPERDVEHARKFSHPADAELYREDPGRGLGFTRVVAVESLATRRGDGRPGTH